MRSLLLLLACVCALPACKTTHTVLAGPANVGQNFSDYDPRRESQNEIIAQQASATGMTDQFGGGGKFQQRFGTADPYGYIGKNPDGTNRIGLNAMNEKIFGGNTKTNEMKSFAQTKDFLTRRYTNTREIGQKESFSQRMTSWFSGRKANADKLARETGHAYYDGNRVIANNANRNDGRTLPGRAFREEGRVARTSDFYPAKKVLDKGADAPPIIGEGDKKSRDAVDRLVRSRPRDNPATVEEIRQLLGKTE